MTKITETTTGCTEDVHLNNSQHPVITSTQMSSIQPCSRHPSDSDRGLCRKHHL